MKEMSIQENYNINKDNLVYQTKNFKIALYSIWSSFFILLKKQRLSKQIYKNI